MTDMTTPTDEEYAAAVAREQALAVVAQMALRSSIAASEKAQACY